MTMVPLPQNGVPQPIVPRLDNLVVLRQQLASRLQRQIEHGNVEIGVDARGSDEREQDRQVGGDPACDRPGMEAATPRRERPVGGVGDHDERRPRRLAGHRKALFSFPRKPSSSPR